MEPSKTGGDTWLPWSAWTFAAHPHIEGSIKAERNTALGRVELQPRGEQQLPSGQPWSRVDQLGDVHPPDGQVQATLAGYQANLEILQ